MMSVKLVQVVAPVWQTSGGRLPFVITVQNTGDEKT
jgi:hypothetical protein